MCEDKARTMVNIDEGFLYGLGAFETVALENGRFVMLDQHLERLRKTCGFLGFTVSDDAIATELDALAHRSGRFACRITATPDNVVASCRENPYAQPIWQRGFDCRISSVRRNETSPLVAHKTLNYAENLLEKRAARKDGFDEPLFLNTRGFATEGATSNFFAVIDGHLVTPDEGCGLLPGIMRGWVLERTRAQRRPIDAGELARAEEIFLTNSLFGIMPVRSLEGRVLPSRAHAEKLRARYLDFIGSA